MSEGKEYNLGVNNKNVLLNEKGEAMEDGQEAMEDNRMAMEDRRVTIKDIANMAGVSLSTVHCALNGKRGVGEGTRERILEIARQYNYHPNTVAASLKRKTIRVAAVFPGLTEENRFYFTYFWTGFRDYLQPMGDYNIEVMEVPFYNGVNNQADELTALLENSKVDGLITSTGYMDGRSKKSIQHFIDKGIPVALVGEDLPQSGRLCCVQPNYFAIGQTVTELLVRQMPKGGRILVCAGDMLIPSHYKVLLGMEAYIEENHLENQIYRVHSEQLKKEAKDHIARGLSAQEDIRGCFAVTARGSVLLGEVLEEQHLAGRVMAVGSDMFEENINNLRNGIFTNLINKNPYSQAYTASKYLVEYILKGIRPPKDTVFTGSEVVFRSSLPMYEMHDYNRLFLS